MKSPFLPLRHRIDDADWELQDLALAIGISTATMTRRMKDGSWKVPEIVKLCRMTGMAPEEVLPLIILPAVEIDRKKANT